MVSGSKDRLISGTKTVFAPVLSDAISYSQKVGKGIRTLFLTKV
jgi:hypothetical protein